jgi:hypothetical protein
VKQKNFSTKQAVKQGERMVLVLKKIIQKSGRTSLKEVTEWMEISPRNANVFVNQLSRRVFGDKQQEPYEP